MIIYFIKKEHNIIYEIKILIFKKWNWALKWLCVIQDYKNYNTYAINKLFIFVYLIFFKTINLKF